MNKAIFVAALLSLICLSFASDVQESLEESSKYYKPPPCPCKCFLKYKIPLATKQCKQKTFLHRCEVSECHPSKKFYYEIVGEQCCDVHIKPSATPSNTPTPSPVKRCPCKCVGFKRAKKMCKKIYSPYCAVSVCKGYGYRPRYQCCDKY